MRLALGTILKSVAEGWIALSQKVEHGGKAQWDSLSLRTLLRVYLLALPGAQRRGQGWTWKKPFVEETHWLGVGGGVCEDEHLVWGPGSDTSFLPSPGLSPRPPNGG